LGAASHTSGSESRLDDSESGEDRRRTSKWSGRAVIEYERK
jgi:hypothetical protein